jgi:UV DNA damage repair endonuclease
LKQTSAPGCVRIGQALVTRSLYAAFAMEKAMYPTSFCSNSCCIVCHDALHQYNNKRQQHSVSTIIDSSLHFCLKAVGYFDVSWERVLVLSSAMLPFVSSSGCSTVVAETASSLRAQGATGLTTAVLPEELSDSDVPIASEETLSFEDVSVITW